MLENEQKERLIADFIAKEAKWGAESEPNAPKNFPIGVRLALNITTFLSFVIYKPLGILTMICFLFKSTLITTSRIAGKRISFELSKDII